MLARPLSRAPRLTRSIVIGRDGGHWNTGVLFVPQAEEWMIERFGGFHRVAKPGLNLAVPLVDRVAYKRTQKETAFPVEPQRAITADNVHVSLGGAVYAAVRDSAKASYNVEDPEYAIGILAQSQMRKLVGELELDQLFQERARLNESISTTLAEATEPWGIVVHRYEVADISVDTHTRDAMERQSNAERLRRAEVLESEGYRQRAINQSEGDRQSAVNEATGRAEAVRLAAAAEADAIKLRADATASGIERVALAIQQPGGADAVAQGIAEQYVGQLADMAKESNMVIVPDRPNDPAGVVATALGLYSQMRPTK